MRLGGACLVLFSHSFVLTGQPMSEPLAWLLGHATDGGRLAVGMFFVVSGFLVTRSALAHAAADYLQARLLRLWPALAVLLVLQTLVLGPAATERSVAAYFADGSTWDALARGMLFNPRQGLPDVFVHNPLPYEVNGSLWTLRVELACYLAVLAAATLGLLRGPVVFACAATGLAVIGAGPVIDLKLSGPGVPILMCGVQFAMGALLWLYRDAVPRHAVLAAAAAAAMWLSTRTWAGPVVICLVLPYLVIWVGLAAPVAERAMRRLGDISYGAYLYAFPVQQALVAWLGPEIGPWRLTALAIPPVLLLGVASRRLVERPALRLKRGTPSAERPALAPGRLA